MPDFHDPFVNAFFTEVYEKEKLTRLKWLNDYYKNTETHNRNSAIDRFIKEYEILHGRRRDVKRTKRRSDDRTKMKTTKSSVINILYDSDSGGAKAYLNEVYKQKPNERHNYPMCTNWEYGWWSGDNRQDAIERKGRVAVMNATFFQRTGLSPDPDHYREPTSFQ